MNKSITGLAYIAPLFLAASFSTQSADDRSTEFKPEQHYKMASYDLKSHGQTISVAEYWSKVNVGEVVLRAEALQTSWKQKGFALSPVLISALNESPRQPGEASNNSFIWVPLISSEKICTYDANKPQPTLSCKKRAAL
jgi:hypothetical protein